MAVPSINLTCCGANGCCVMDCQFSVSQWSLAFFSVMSSPCFGYISLSSGHLNPFALFSHPFYFFNINLFSIRPLDQSRWSSTLLSDGARPLPKGDYGHRSTSTVIWTTPISCAITRSRHQTKRRRAQLSIILPSSMSPKCRDLAEACTRDTQAQTARGKASQPALSSREASARA